MKLAMIADDLTGANDSGVQLAKYGLRTAVLFEPDGDNLLSFDAVVIDTDSRATSGTEAYNKVKIASELLRSGNFDVFYKKVDSTLRGNIGVEIDAMYDVLQPDFMIIAPAYPKNGRQTIDGIHYLNGKPINETEIANDPKTPVREANVASLLAGQTRQQVSLITCEQLRDGYEYVKERFDSLKHQNISYVVFDAEHEEDLRLTVQYVLQSGYSVCWVGSAGLANYLPDQYGLKVKEHRSHIDTDDQLVMLVVGSVSQTTRRQLEVVLQESGIEGVKLDSTLIVTSQQSRIAEVQRAFDQAMLALSNERHIALYTSASAMDVQEARRIGKGNGMDELAVSNEISVALGEVASRIMAVRKLRGMVLTGGDTAKQVCTQIGVKGFELLDEVETGIPFGRTIGDNQIYTITKAGAFGTETSLLNSMNKLRGGAL